MTSSHQKAMLRNMANALFKYEKINTTLKKAKILKSFAEKLITIAKRDDLHSRRLVARDINDKEVLKKIFDVYSSRYQTTPGGYTRIIKIPPRKGDAADMASIILVGSDVSSSTTDKKKKSK